MGIFGHIHFAGAPDEAFWLSASPRDAGSCQPAGYPAGSAVRRARPRADGELVQAVAQRRHKPDYLLLVNEKLAGPAMLSMADQAGIPCFLSFNQLDPAQLQASGLPRQRLKHWLGSLTPDNAMAGSLTCKPAG
jgi:hypothetical protein